MAEYINRAAAVAISDYAADEHPYEKLGGANSSEYNEGWNDACDYIREKLENEPAADVAPVVRCKDCVWRGREECAMFYRCDCGEQHTWETDDDFCSYGERKEPGSMSTRIRPAIEKLAEMEKQDANRKFPLFHSMHEGYAVLLEEIEEAREALNFAEGSLSMLWAHIRDNNAGRALEFAGRVREHALDLAVEAVQVAAMAQKFIDSAKKEDHHEQSD